MSEVEEKVLGFFTTIYHKQPGELSLETNLMEDLDTRSILKMSVLALIEEEYDVDFSIVLLGECPTIGDVARKVEELMA